MPFSSDGDAIDFIYGVINWKNASLPAGPRLDEARRTTRPPPE